MREQKSREPKETRETLLFSQFFYFFTRFGEERGRKGIGWDLRLNWIFVQ